MPTQACLKNIDALDPPYNVPCRNEFCEKISGLLGNHCSKLGYPVDTPVISYDPDKHIQCNCCCSCYALNTPIEATKGEFVLIQNIQPGDSILTSGIDLRWKPGIVKDRSGDINTSLVPGLYLVRYLMPGEKELRDILVTPDHLFLMYSSKTLKKVQHLIPGNRLTTAEGEPADVVFVVHGEYETSIQSITMKAKFDGKDLTGHLINANGIVSTDYTVQCYYETQNVANNLAFKFSNQDEVHEVGSKEYIEKFESPQLAAFLSAPEEWPKGFYPKRHQLINIPGYAQRFITPGQAEDIRLVSEFNSYSNGVPRDSVNKLFKLFLTDYNHVNFILDWHNEEVNAYAWEQNQQSYLVLTGGLVRLKNVFVDGIALIISDMLSRLSGKSCLVEADYYSFDVLSSVFPYYIYAEFSFKGLQQIINHLFDKISPQQAAGNPADVCDCPSIACRKDAFNNGISFLGVPKCGMPVPPYFTIKRAYASYDLKFVYVEFDNAVNPESAQALVNYTIEPGVEITAAQVKEDEPGTVILEVESLRGAGKYILSVAGVVSIDNQPLAEGTYTVIVTA